MSHNKQFTERYAAIVMEAYQIVYRENACFTLDAFAKRTGRKPNRHLAAALKKAVLDGRLEAYRMLFSDGYYRIVYFAPDWDNRNTDHFRRMVALREKLEQERAS